MKTNFCKKSNDVLNIKDNLIVLGNNMETDQNIYNVDTFRDKLRMESGIRANNRNNSKPVQRFNIHNQHNCFWRIRNKGSDNE